MSLSFQRGDIVIGAPGWGAGCYCILDVDPARPRYVYTAVHLVNNKRYSLTDEGLIKVGTATEDFLSGGSPGAAANDPSVELRFQRGKARAEHESWASSGITRKRWEILAAARPGDIIKFQHSCGHLQDLKFRFVVERGTRFVFVAENSAGQMCKYPLDIIKVEEAMGPIAVVNLDRQPLSQ